MEYIRIPKELLSSEMWRCNLSANTKLIFLDLISRAAYNRYSKTYMKQQFMLKKGELITTVRSLAKDLEFNEYTIRKAMSELVTEGLIKIEITQGTHKRNAQHFMENRTKVTICNIEHYAGRITPINNATSHEEIENLRTLNRKEEEKEIKNKKKQIIETPLKLVQKEEEQMVMLDPEAIGFKQGVCHSPWIRSLVKLTKEPQDSIEQMAMDYAEMKFHEGNLSLSIKSFRYNCKNFITNLLTKKEKNDGKERTKQQKPQQPTIPQHRIADVDISRVPGHSMSIIGRKEGKDVK
ncbi:MAG: hypothetical protein ACRCZM_11710 [Bacteroidales bacterium]